MDEKKNREIYDSEFRDWLPGKVFDAHIHIVTRTAYPPDYDPGPAHWMSHVPGREFTFEQCAAWAAANLPEQEFSGLCFGSPSGAEDRDAANRYVAAQCDNERWFGLALVSPEDSPEQVERWIRDTPLLGYKPYRNYVTNKPRESVGIHDMLPAAHMALADRLGLVVMLHIPRARRLADPDNQREILELADRYPRARIVLAHIGRAYYLANVVGQLDDIRTRPNLYVDLAMLNHWEVLEYLFREFPRERILFGTDLPISCFGGKSVEINNGYAYVMEEDIDIGAAIYDARGVVQFTSFYYEELRAIRKAAERVGLSAEEREGIFFGNAGRLLREAAASKAAG